MDPEKPEMGTLSELPFSYHFADPGDQGPLIVKYRVSTLGMGKVEGEIRAIC